jgi:hypothetical protein
LRFFIMVGRQLSDRLRSRNNPERNEQLNLTEIFHTKKPKKVLDMFVLRLNNFFLTHDQNRIPMPQLMIN